jgi:hypothetical protein
MFTRMPRPKNGDAPTDDTILPRRQYPDATGIAAAKMMAAEITAFPDTGFPSMPGASRGPAGAGGIILPP